jgi:hypothetical protein
MDSVQRKKQINGELSEEIKFRGHARDKIWEM